MSDEGEPEPVEPSPDQWPSLLLCVAGGASVALVKAGIGALVLVARGQIGGAAALLAVCAVSGGGAGVVYYLTTPIRRSQVGLHLSWMLAVQAYLFAAGGALVLVGRQWPQLADPRSASSIEDPVFWAFLSVAGVLCGLLLGYQAQRRQRREADEPGPRYLLVLPGVGGLGALAVIAGATFVYLGERDRPLAEEVHDPPTPVRLADLTIGGAGGNRRVRVTDFRFCRVAVVEPNPRSEVRYEWHPLVAASGDPKSDAPPVPRTIGVAVRNVDVGLDDLKINVRGKAARVLGANLSQRIREKQEQEGLEATVVNGVHRLTPAAREALIAAAPDTDLNAVILLDPYIEAVPAATIQERVWGGWAAVAVGMLILGLVAVSASRSGASAASEWQSKTDGEAGAGPGDAADE